MNLIRECAEYTEPRLLEEENIKPQNTHSKKKSSNKPEECNNYLLCNQYINKSVNNRFCKDCLFYFNYKMTFKMNVNDNLVCPLCLYSTSVFIKQKNCNHYICISCIHNVYFDKSFIKNIPHNPIQYLKKSWDLYIYSNSALNFKKNILNKFADYEFNDYRCNNLTEQYKFLIPNLFKKHIKSLIKYQLQKDNYITTYKDNQYEKIKILKICPYCRSSNNFVKSNYENL